MISGIHPEHLLERERAGELDAAERAQLDAHLSSCVACRFEREVRSDFADELAGEDPPVRCSGLVNEILPVTQPESKPSRPRRFKLAWLVAAAVMLLGAVAVASESGRRVWMPMLGLQPVTITAPSPTALVPPEPAAHWAPVTHDPTVLPAVDMTPDPQPIAASLAPTSQSLFDQESEARRRGDYDRAVELHSLLVTRYPQSREAQVSRVTIARMLLDRGDASSALVGFDAYLRNGGGELSEEAMLGRATALERLGRSTEARAAWQAILDRYENGPYAAQARARLAALAGK